MVWSALRSGNLSTALIYLALSLPAIVLCLSVHEASHGFAAYLLGDKTARNAGRLTLSPLAHIDPWGFLMLLLFGFGWARPVPVNVFNFKNRKAGMAITALAGPFSNFLLSFVFFVLTFLAYRSASNSLFIYAIYLFCQIVASMSIGLGVFNLIPVYPLDGSRVLDAILPFGVSQRLRQYQSIIILVFIAALWFGWLNGIISGAAMAVANLAQHFLMLF